MLQVKPKSQSDIDGRLRLFRYGVVVVVVFTFFLVLLAPYAFLRGADVTTVDGRTVQVEVSITEFLVNAAIATVVALVLGVVLYFVYRWALMRVVASEGAATTTTQ
jgi:predicted ABC-type sugar transport system permease subunit